MNGKMFYALCVLVLVSLSFLPSCGQQTDTPTTTTTLAPQILTLSGKLSTGTITNFGVTALSATSDYRVVAVNNANNKTYYADMDAGGNFSLTIPGSSSYEVSLIDKNSSEYFGPVTMAGNSSSSEVMMGIKPTNNANLGEIVIDPTKNMAKPTSEPLSIINAGDKASATQGIPTGAGSCGKNALCTATREGSDMDKDGIPNIFDADEDGDKIRNGILLISSTKTVSSNTVEAVFLTSNIWAMHGTTDTAKDLIGMWINVTTPNDTALNQIASVEVIDVPSSIKDIATIRFSSSIGDPIGYPAENSLWKTSGYNLYKTTTLARNQYIVSLCPRAIMNVGDIFTIRVTYTGGGYEDFMVSTSYIMTDWARVLTYNGTTLASTEGLHTTATAAQFNTSTLEVVFTKALDEDGNVLTGLQYSIIINQVSPDASGVLPVSSGTMNEFRATDYPAAFTEGASSVTALLDRLVTFEAGKYYYITPVAESKDGQRNGEQTWFYRQ